MHGVADKNELCSTITEPLTLPHRYIQSTCATSGEGLYEGLDWLSNNIASKVREIITQEFIDHFEAVISNNLSFL